jgi:3-oxoacyl-[acyl-carrier protein] reductase
MSHNYLGLSMSSEENNQTALQGQVALVSGAASGLGAAVTRQLLQSGADVIANYRSDYGVLDELKALAESTGRRFMIVKGDVARDEDCRAIAAAAKDWGRIDILVNNAGTTKHVPHADLEAMLSEDFGRIMQINVIGAFQLTRAVLPLMRSAHALAERARPIVMISSVAGVLANGSSIAYSASKAAMNNMTMALARALAPAIRVNAVCPGLIDTPWFEKGVGEEQAAKIRAMAATHLPLQRVPTADEIAQTVMMLCRDETAHVTGTHLLVDDGLSLLPMT